MGGEAHDNETTAHSDLHRASHLHVKRARHHPIRDGVEYQRGAMGHGGDELRQYDRIVCGRCIAIQDQATAPDI